MELTIFKNPIPIKAIPEENLNNLIMGDFLDWISNTLSLNEDAVTKLEYALPAIKQHCWSMGFPEIKKMFEMYVDGNLSVKPIPNHFDRIKFGEVVNAYKQQKKVVRAKPEEPEISEEVKERKWIQFIINCFEQYKHDKTMLIGFTSIYTHFYGLNKFPKHDYQFREKIRERALRELKTGSKVLSSYEIITKGSKPNYSEINISNMAKQLILSDWFDKLIENNINIETEI
tara:strand:- start:3438 stop:4127 length:690 start_codon:yes stop_codon:yes gene_type:complete